MEIHQVFSSTADIDDALLFDMDFTDQDGTRMRAVYPYRPSDTHSSLTTIITQWLSDNPDQKILPYTPPSELTTEQLRTRMPDKTPREFRDILTDMGIFSQMVAEKINEIPFDIERQKALNAWEVSTYISRTDPYVDMIGAMFDKSPVEIDTGWVA